MLGRGYAFTSYFYSSFKLLVSTALGLYHNRPYQCLIYKNVIMKQNMFHQCYSHVILDIRAFREIMRENKHNEDEMMNSFGTDEM